MIYNTNQFTHFVSISTDDTYKIEFYFESREIKTVYIPEQENVSLLIKDEINMFYQSIPHFMKRWGYRWSKKQQRWVK